jgi:hypothetical protein
MRVRRLTPEGLRLLQEFLVRVSAGEPRTGRQEILTGDATSELLATEASVDEQSFPTRLAVARYLNDKLEPLGPHELEDPGLWGWLALLYFDTLCPASKKKPGSLYRWIPSGSFRTDHRHLLAGPFRIYRLYRENPGEAAVLLCNAPDKPGDFPEQLASRQEFLTNRAIIGAATRLYVETGSGRAKRGASPSDHEPGTLRRFVDVVQQLDLTFDLYSLTPEELVAMLPPEFEPYRQAS